MAALLWCASPLALGYGYLCTADAGGAFAAIASAYAFRTWLRKPSWTSAAVSGVALGIAQLARTILVVFIGLWVILWIIHILSRRTPPHPTFMRSLVQLLVQFAIMLYVLNAGYAFEGTFQRLGDYQFSSARFAGTDVKEATFGNRFRDSLLSELRVPVPANYVLGMDVQLKDCENTYGHMRSYLRGEWRSRGWWYYYLYALAIKVPVGVLLLTALRVRDLCHTRPWPQIAEEAFICAPMLAIVGLVSSQTGFNHHVRYCLPLVPFWCVWLGKLGTCTYRLNASGVCVAGCLVWSVASAAFVYPHELSYFNELIGGPRNGAKHLVDSNIDFGQDLLFVQEWRARHSDATPLRLSYYGAVPLELVGLESVGEEIRTEPRNQTALPPGWYVVSVCHLHGDGPLRRDLEQLVQRTPRDAIGYSMCVYEIR